MYVIAIKVPVNYNQVSFNKYIFAKLGQKSAAHSFRVRKILTNQLNKNPNGRFLKSSKPLQETI